MEKESIWKRLKWVVITCLISMLGTALVLPFLKPIGEKFYDFFDKPLIYAIDSVQLTNVDGERDNNYPVKSSLDGPVYVYTPHFVFNFVEEQGHFTDNTYVILMSDNDSDEESVIEEKFSLVLNDNNTSKINLNINTIREQEYFTLYFAMQDRKTKEYKISLLQLKMKELPLCSIFESVPIGEGKISIVANGVVPISKKGDLDITFLSEHQLEKMDLRDATDAETDIYSSRVTHKNNINAIKKSLK